MTDQTVKPEPASGREVIESLVFLVDVQNLYCSVRDSYGVAARVDFRKLREAALKGRKFRHIVSRAYFASRPDESPKGFIHALRKLSYDVKVTDIRPHDKGAPSGTNIDSQLVTDATNITINGQAPSVVVIASGDSDFLPVYERLKTKGCRVEVLAFTPSMSSQVADLVDEVTELDRDYLFAESPITESVGVDKPE
jgi:uncharacterized LabA/DUF88 family protein